jgi:hypothetical protein
MQPPEARAAGRAEERGLRARDHVATLIVVADAALSAWI